MRAAGRPAPESPAPYHPGQRPGQQVPQRRPTCGVPAGGKAHASRPPRAAHAPKEEVGHNQMAAGRNGVNFPARGGPIGLSWKERGCDCPHTANAAVGSSVPSGRSGNSGRVAWGVTAITAVESLKVGGVVAVLRQMNENSVADAMQAPRHEHVVRGRAWAGRACVQGPASLSWLRGHASIAHGEHMQKAGAPSTRR